MRNLLELLELGRISTEPDRFRAVQEIKEQSGRMLTLVTDYLSVHAAESGQIPVRLAKIDLGALSAAVRSRPTPSLREKPKSRGAPDPVPVWVFADESLLHQIADNFVANAIKFSPPGAPLLLEVQLAATLPRAHLAVSKDSIRTWTARASETESMKASVSFAGSDSGLTT